MHAGSNALHEINLKMYSTVNVMEVRYSNASQTLAGTSSNSGIVSNTKAPVDNRIMDSVKKLVI